MTTGEPEEVVKENALRKARAVARELANQLVLGADTEVAIDGRVYGKADTVEDARSHLELLSGRVHHVWSGIALVRAGAAHEQVGTERTAVRFRDLDEHTIAWYLESDEWRGRAGSYAIQGRGAALVERIEGDYWNVVGLPVALLLDMAPSLLP